MLHEQIVDNQNYAAHLFKIGQNYMEKGMPLMAKRYFSDASIVYRLSRRLLLEE